MECGGGLGGARRGGFGCRGWGYAGDGWGSVLGAMVGGNVVSFGEHVRSKGSSSFSSRKVVFFLL